MYSRDETVDAVLRFYHQVVRHPYLNDNALIVPPPNGWKSIDVQGKNETVLDLLRFLPYLRSDKPFERLLIHWETIPICYFDSQVHQEIYILPVHCVYLTRSVDREGTSLILDTNEGTITEFSHTGSHIVVPHDEYEALPEPEKWKAHRTSPVTELLDTWARRYEKLVWMLAPNPIGQPITGRFYSRAESRVEEEELVKQGQLEPWYPQDDTNHHDDNESDLDRGQREARGIARKHAADVYNTYLRHGWPDQFDKELCRAELLELGKREDEDERRRLDEVNPDAALFD
ncbi:hypothetical protein F4677DRAFT_438352 [Hypoxylon crocopeplum]|nr:hypothetical protein F4677DRAFT_438352 [Hypoxylon crocopeplum]